MQSYTEGILREGIVYLLWGAVADLGHYLGPHAPVSEIINKLELLYGTIASFHVLIQKFYKLHKGEMEKIPAYMTLMEGALDAVQQECLNLLSIGKVQKHLRVHLFHGI